MNDTWVLNDVNSAMNQGYTLYYKFNLKWVVEADVKILFLVGNSKEI